MHGRTALHLAAIGNLTDAVSILLDAGADMLSTDLDGNTALHLAYAYTASATISLLETKGSNEESINMLGKTPLECAGCLRKFKGIF